MKFTLLALTLAFTSVSHAQQKPYGFMPELCSDEQAGAKANTVKEVCVGEIVGQVVAPSAFQRTIQLTLGDGSVRLYSVIFTNSVDGMGAHSTTFSGNVTPIRMLDRISGVFATTSGITVTWGIKLVTDGGLKFQGHLHQVFSTGLSTQ